MRISDWSSDVCSSDLTGSPELIFASYSWARRLHMVRFARLRPFRVVRAVSIILRLDSLRRPELAAFSTGTRSVMRYFSNLMPIRSRAIDRKSVGKGKSVYVRVEMGRAGLLKKKK